MKPAPSFVAQSAAKPGRPLVLAAEAVATKRLRHGSGRRSNTGTPTRAVTMTPFRGASEHRPLLRERQPPGRRAAGDHAGLATIASSPRSSAIGWPIIQHRSIPPVRQSRAPVPLREPVEVVHLVLDIGTAFFKRNHGPCRALNQRLHPGKLPARLGSSLD
jgi:hypothetical protein